MKCANVNIQSPYTEEEKNSEKTQVWLSICHEQLLWTVAPPRWRAAKMQKFLLRKGCGAK